MGYAKIVMIALAFFFAFLEACLGTPFLDVLGRLQWDVQRLLGWIWPPFLPFQIPVWGSPGPFTWRWGCSSPGLLPRVLSLSSTLDLFSSLLGNVCLTSYTWMYPSTIFISSRSSYHMGWEKTFVPCFKLVRKVSIALLSSGQSTKLNLLVILLQGLHFLLFYGGKDLTWLMPGSY